jgi:hypothetical protein
VVSDRFEVWERKKMTSLYRNRFRFFCAGVFFFFLLSIRRWEQLVSPQVWDEDGTRNLYEFINSGWISLFEPVNGYLILIPKIITGSSLYLSFASYPFISTIISWFFIVFVGLVVAFGPLKINGSFFAASLMFLIPSDPEIFGLPLYTFWWAAILLFAIAIWDEKKPINWLRYLIVLLCGLSSPVVIMLLPIFYYRAYVYRSLKGELVIAIFATIVALVQSSFVFNQNIHTVTEQTNNLVDIIPLFLGRFLVGNIVEMSLFLWFVGIILSMYIAWYVWNNRNSYITWVLIYLLAGSIALSVARIDLSIIHPAFAGPRYFFFPFVVMAWFLSHAIFSTRSKQLKAISIFALSLAVVNSFPVLSRKHDDLRWVDHVHSCCQFTSYEIPIQYDGHKERAWKLPVTGKQCETLLDKDFFNNIYLGGPTYPYFYHEFDDRHISSLSSFASLSVVNKTTWKGHDYHNSELDGFRVIGSWLNSDADTGEITLRLKRGDRILYRSGPGSSGQSIKIIGHSSRFIHDLPSALDWVIMDFSNKLLPQKFTVTLSDNGKGWGEWSAIALRD